MANQNAQTPSTDKGAQKAKDAANVSAEKTQAQLDEAAKQTFPASDAPASWAGKDIAPQDRKDA
ncbi:MAG: hypothetical protein RLZZ450_6327 [Pseudomonadota bacterium]|jgi:hypothetical protein